MGQGRIFAETARTHAQSNFALLAEIKRVRVALFQFEFTSGQDGPLPEAQGAVQTITEKVYVPAKQYPEVR